MAYYLHGLCEAIIRLLTENPGSGLKTVAAKLGVERHTIEKAVKTCKGVTFRDLRSQIIVSSARRMLVEEPCLTVAQVAHRLGLSSGQTLTRTLKKHTGCGAVGYRLARGTAAI